jgi:hypothetical protein
MKYILLVALIAGAGWWYFIGGRQLTEEQVKEFYRNLETAALDRKPEDLCALLADDFTASGTVAIGGWRLAASENKAQSCQAYKDLYASWEKLGEKLGGELQLDTKYEIHSIDISRDGKTAAVDYSSSLDVADNLTNIRSRSTDTLIRRNGKVLMLSSKGTGSVSSGA